MKSKKILKGSYDSLKRDLENHLGKKYDYKKFRTKLAIFLKNLE